MVAVITTKDKVEAAEREVAMRKRVYPRWVELGLMNPGRAALQIQIMEAIAADYRAQYWREGGDAQKELV